MMASKNAILTIAFAVAKAKLEGFEIADELGLYVFDHHYHGRASVNPIATVLLGTWSEGETLIPQDLVDDAARILEVTSGWILAFLSGSGDEEDPNGHCDDAWHAGSGYRASYDLATLVLVARA